MKLLAILAAYVASAAALFGVLFGGVFWLVQPDPSGARERRTATIPPRIAESIERKWAPLPQIAPAKAAEPVHSVMAPVRAVMHEAPVSLTPAPKVRIREVAAPTAAKRKTRPVALREAAATQAPPAAAAVRPVASGRSDSPY